jgi:hypothetical protein
LIIMMVAGWRGMTKAEAKPCRDVRLTCRAARLLTGAKAATVAGNKTSPTALVLSRF